MITLENGCIQFESGDIRDITDRDLANKQLRDWFESLDRVRGFLDDDGKWYVSGKFEESVDTHEMRLTKPVPIVRDSFEQVVKDLADWPRVGNSTEMFKLVDRARKLLDKGG